MSFPKYETYKDSGVEWLGEVPKHWNVEPLKRSCQIFPSNVDKKSYEEQIPVLLCNYTDVYYNEEIVSGMQLMSATATKEQIEKFTLQAGDVVFTKDSESADDIAIAAYIPQDLSGVICGYHLSVVRSSAETDGAFVKRFFDSQSAKAYFAVSANGLTRVGLSQYATDNIPTPIPPLSEQTQIARFLDYETARIDELIAEQERLIALLKEKRQAVISHAVTKGCDRAVPMKDSGVEWLGEVPEHWQLTKLKFVVERIVDCPHETPVYDLDGDYLVIRTADVDKGTLKTDSMYHLNCEEYLNRIRREPLNKDDIVYGREGERWGHAALVPTSDLFALGQRMMQFRAERNICSSFLTFQLNSVSTYRQGDVDTVGATSPHVNISTIRNYQLMMPPFDEQFSISKYLQEISVALDSLIEEAINATEILQERRSALISAAVTGKIDVRNWQPPADTPSNAASAINHH